MYMCTLYITTGAVSSITAVGGLYGMYKTAVPAGITVPCAVQICSDFIELISH